MTKRYRPNVTVACIIECQGKFLLVEEKINGNILFNQPAGHLEANESLIDACKREVKEETGLDVEPQKLVGIHQFSASSELAFLRFTYSVKLTELKKSTPKDPQIMATHWLSYDEIKSIKLKLRSPLIIDSIDEYYQNKGVDINFIDSRFL